MGSYTLKQIQMKKIYNLTEKWFGPQWIYFWISSLPKIVSTQTIKM